ncbi:MAG: MBL fold metallo-hydrolase [Desulfomonilaceae bacterium]
MGEIVFLGTGSAWRTPEHNCQCAICSTMREKKEERTRSSVFLRCASKILIDCGPDLLTQMKANSIERPDAVLVTHEHGDHFLGMDELLAFKRSVPPSEWKPIPVYASKGTWKAIEMRFSYLIGSVIEKNVVVPNEPVERFHDIITPFKTNHGSTAPGSVGYVIETVCAASYKKIVYTSDFVSLPSEPDFLKNSSILIFQAHWLNEPDENRPSHMSLQRGIEFIKRWNPTQTVYLTHISASDIVEGDLWNNIPKKPKCSSPMLSPVSSAAYPTPRCQSEWQSVADRVGSEFEVNCRIVVPTDSMSVNF